MRECRSWVVQDSPGFVSGRGEGKKGGGELFNYLTPSPIFNSYHSPGPVDVISRVEAGMLEVGGVPYLPQVDKTEEQTNEKDYGQYQEMVGEPSFRCIIYDLHII